MRDRILLILKGIAMGAADVVPGVSGGTIAFITGIYDTLIGSIKSLNIAALKLLLKGEFRNFWRHINGAFLLTLFTGIAISVVSLAKLMKYLLENSPIEVWSFFFGLIIASALLVSKSVTKWSVGAIISIVIGTVVAFSITTFAPSSTPDTWYFTVLSGAIAICAMILPGISGSFILLLLGKYNYIIGAVSDMNIAVIAEFGIGAAIGIVAFSHVLSWLLKRYHNIFVALLTGFMIGSLNKVWPWKRVVETYLDRHGVEKPLIEDNILPSTFESIAGNSSAHLPLAIGLAIAGFMLIWGLERYATSRNK